MQNPEISGFIQTNPRHFYTVYLIMTSFFVYTALTAMPWHLMLGFFFIGFMLWSLAEYFLHRYIFHWQSNHFIARNLAYFMHGIHHVYPREVRVAITPLLITLPLAVMFYSLFVILFNNKASAVFAGFLSGYVLYTLIHNATHHFAMNLPLLRQLKKNHMHHHYFNHDGNFGVSTPLWDYVFRTYQKK